MSEQQSDIQKNQSSDKTMRMHRGTQTIQQHLTGQLQIQDFKVTEPQDLVSKAKPMR